MVPSHSWHIYEIWRSKEMGDSLKSSFGVAMQATREGARQFLWRMEVLCCIETLFKYYWVL